MMEVDLNIEEPKSAECKPLTSLEELLSWRPADFGGPFTPCDLREGLRKCSHLGDVMYIHDMKDGYLDDRFPEGNENLNAFRFYHWHLIDFFVYFSHKLVTIPPLSWIEVSHRNGVPMLGTFITEWEKGEAIVEFILSCPRRVEHAANQLISIAKTLNFDGWLINIENPIRKELLNPLYDFLTILTESDLCIVWYDSVTTDGKLLWQNELNDLNWPFFDVLSQNGGKRGRILLNYTWDEDKLNRSRAFALQNNLCPKSVFAGVDVFGRGCPGGGGFHSDEAVRLVTTRPSLSVGLFAPGWVMETLPPGDSFHERNRAFWAKLEELLGGARPLQDSIKTDFSLAQGPRCFKAGRRQPEGPDWRPNDMRKQQMMPHFFPKPSDPYELEFDPTVAFGGTNCLRVTLKSAEPVEVPLFATWFENEHLKSFSVALRWPKSGPGPMERFTALLVKCRNREVDQEENRKEVERRLCGATSPDDDVYRVFVLGLAGDSPMFFSRSQEKALFRRLRRYCVEHYRMDELCLISGRDVSSLARPVLDPENLEFDQGWVSMSMRGFGRPGELEDSQTYVSELGLLVWDLRKPQDRRSACSFVIGGLQLDWSSERIRRHHVNCFPRTEEEEEEEEEAEEMTE